MKIDRSTILLVLAALAVGYWFSGSDVSPAKPDRPVARWIARAAKNALWFMLVAEPAPPAATNHLVHGHHVGEDGYQVVDHGDGW